MGFLTGSESLCTFVASLSPSLTTIGFDFGVAMFPCGLFCHPHNEQSSTDGG
jgi:hypothetical protein